ncbi:MAG: ATP-dependent DNA helicase RecG [Acetobacteraceae bacterium]|nr:ATP-dependent DNA helicase RecG [Acetobacteraceae bacterium]
MESAPARDDQAAHALLAARESLPGVPAAAWGRIAALVGGRRLADLLLHLPERFESRLAVARLDQAAPGARIRIRASAESHRAARARSGRPYVEVRVRAGGAPLLLRFMNGRLPWLLKLLPPGEERVLAGELRADAEGFQLINPEVAASESDLPLTEPVWPLSAGVTHRMVARAVRAGLSLLPPVPEWQDAALLRREGWPGFAEALRALHAPDTPPGPAPRRRLEYDELLAGQVAIALLRRRVRGEPGRSLTGDGRLRAAALAAFGKPLTPWQQAAVAEIDADLAAPRRMLRLLQGDVGSGKTLVALLAMLRAVEAGAQAALMAPTELLARQHHRSIAPLAAAAGVPVVLLTGSLSTAERRRALRAIAEGSARIAIGTHALFQKGVAFRDLALAVVDEQHRFGVAERLALASKGAQPVDVLAMTATPIPRTLLLTQWGEVAVTRLLGKPAGRQPIATGIVSQERLPEVVERLAAALARGERAYWVVRAIQGGEHDDSVAAEDRFAELSARFPGLVGLAHGEQETAVREAALADFAAGRTRLLVATTVVEVGVDVPEATIMIIEQAERFGLSALHQLRGRVGRGAARSACLLVHSPGLSESGRRRLLVLRDTEDGFEIAEQDLILRGGGDALGARQSGRMGFRLADPEADPAEFSRLVAIAHRDAELLLERDPSLASARGRAMRLCLALFGHDVSMAVLNAG